jgi:hypothetical protein
MRYLRRNRLRKTWPGYFYLLPPDRRYYMPWRWIQSKGDSAMLARIIRFHGIETGNRLSAEELALAINVPEARIERAPAFKYRGKPRRRFIARARLRYGTALPARMATACPPDLVTIL